MGKYEGHNNVDYSLFFSPSCDLQGMRGRDCGKVITFFSGYAGGNPGIKNL
jgi:hypothetical protein